jgi:hypothetical protein
MLLHELLDAGLVGVADGPQPGVELMVVLDGDGAVAPHALAVIVEKPLLAEGFGHGALGLAVVAEELFEAVFGLRITGAKGGGFAVAAKRWGTPYSSRRISPLVAPLSGVQEARKRPRCFMKRRNYGRRRGAC